jgi:hypothetical protein
VIGTSNKGPAFVPVTVANFGEFINVFGNLDPKQFGPYAANEFLKHRSALTYLRILGAGTNSSLTDITSYQTSGRVKNAGFKMEGVAAVDDAQGRHTGVVQFLCARHQLQNNEMWGSPDFTDNSSFNGSVASLVRGVIMTPAGARVMILDGDQSAVGAFSTTGPDDYGSIVGNKFKLVISSTLGNSFYNTDGNKGIRIFTASLDPSSDDYFAKILNKDPDKFIAEQHLLYADLPVDAELAAASEVGILSGTINTSTTSGEAATTFRAAYGAFNTRYTTPKTTWFISQPYGTNEYDLFHFETLDDGEYANSLYKVSISNLQRSSDDANPWGTFTVEIRDWNDTDSNPNVIERFPNCTLDPQSSNYVARLIGDRKVFYNFDATTEGDRKVITSGKYPNVSAYVRVKMSDAVENSLIPTDALPFGFRGAQAIKTTDSLKSYGTSADAHTRINGLLGAATTTAQQLTGSIVPPLPMQFKVTRGERLVGGTYTGEPGISELATPLYYWGVRFERANTPLDPNTVGEKNALLESYTKFMGIQKLDTLATGSGADALNDNKFTLAKVALGTTDIAYLTASINDHMKTAAYIRNGKLDPTTYTIYDAGLGNRITFGTLLSKATPAQFNRFAPYLKFTSFFQGGFNGVNFLDRDARRMNDKASSFEAGGGANATYVSPGFSTNQAGAGQDNNTVSSYKTAVKIMTNPMAVTHNVVTLPGIREPFITDLTLNAVKSYGLAYYILDIPAYDDNLVRLYDDSAARPSVGRTISQFTGRVIDNNFGGTYWPDVDIDDNTNARRVAVPASIAALGALAFNDKVGYPWFAPAGFNRASLDFVKNVKVRLNVTDRDALYDARINPIAAFPRLGYTIWGQKTLQLNKSALDRVNVRRMLLEVKRIVINIARRVPFEQNTPTVRNNFVALTTVQLAMIQAQAGIEQFKVIMNETNNTQQDIDLNRVNGKIIVVPTRTIEFIAIDFIVTNSGVAFV